MFGMCCSLYCMLIYFLTKCCLHAMPTFFWNSQISTKQGFRSCSTSQYCVEFLGRPFTRLVDNVYGRVLVANGTMFSTKIIQCTKPHYILSDHARYTQYVHVSLFLMGQAVVQSSLYECNESFATSRFKIKLSMQWLLKDCTSSDISLTALSITNLDRRVGEYYAILVYAWDWFIDRIILH